ncbi:ABC-type transport auxiliary lipoprotein family protein [Ramlibacter sp. AN1015]|uniref:ABC-type transport auxiliary lipoprotein family protein n=1 Tax=Ramlibacter sp. AN1015 TaxID=3133428 RepID=UPI0030C4736F
MSTSRADQVEAPWHALLSRLRLRRGAVLCALVAACAGCTSIVSAPEQPTLFDLGPLPAPAAAPADAAAPLVLPELEASGLLDRRSILYRLDYGDGRALLPYGASRWSAPVAELVHERIAAHLARERTVLRPGEMTAVARAGAQAPQVLRLQLQEFAQHFDAPGRSHGRVRVLATLLQSSPTGDRLLGQRAFRVSAPAPTGDAAGGVAALSQAVDALALQLGQWLQEHSGRRAP